MKIDDSVMVTVPLNKMIIVEEDHGSYLAGFCAVCRQHGWIDEGQNIRSIQHTKECIVGNKLSELRKETQCSL